MTDDKKYIAVEVNVHGDVITDKMQAKRPTREQILKGVPVPQECEVGGARILNADGTEIVQKQEEVKMDNGKIKKVVKVKAVVSEALVKKAKEALIAAGRTDGNIEGRSELYLVYMTTGEMPKNYTEFRTMKSGERDRLAKKLDNVELLKKIASSDLESNCIQLGAKKRLEILAKQKDKKSKGDEKVKTVKTDKTIKPAPKKKVASKTKKVKAKSKETPAIDDTVNTTVPIDDPEINALARSAKKVYYC